MDRKDVVNLWFELLVLRITNNSLVENLKKMVTGSFIQFFRMIRKEREFSNTLDEYDELSHITRKKCNEYLASELSYKYGRNLTPYQIAAVKRLEAYGYWDEDIRLMVANNILDSSGNIRISNTKEKLLSVAGWIFLIMCATIFVSFSILIWGSALPILYKLLFELVLLIVVVHSGYVMSYFSILPGSAIRALEK